jgi:transaldolase
MATKKRDGALTALKKQFRAAAAADRPWALNQEGRAPVRDCHAGNITQLACWGHTKLAADHILFPEINGSLMSVIAGAARQLGVKFFMARPDAAASDGARAASMIMRIRCYDWALETFLNFMGLESSLLDDDEKELAAEFLLETLVSWERWECDEYGAPLAAEAAVDRLLAGMELVQGGASMVAKTAQRIRAATKGRSPVTPEFLLAARDEIQDNVYFHMAALDYCKFGNDYALGLRWLRHLGFQQVSTNPVLAAKAYEDDPALQDAFKLAAAAHPQCAEWIADPAAHADDIALSATLEALWDNLHVFRPVFYNLAGTTGGGVVSFQLNPNIAHKAQASIMDALTALEYAQQDLRLYDSYPLAGYDMDDELARPNMVIKVAASNPAARAIARAINEHGLGSNVTVIYTVAQQVTMILEEMAGMAAAIRKGILPTQLYMTNMGGRFESHLREDALLRLFQKLKKKIGADKALARITALAKANGTLEKVKAAASFEDKVYQASCYANGVREIDAPVIRALDGAASKAELVQLEEDLQKSGTLVARRVWHIFFSEKNREKWVDWLCRAHALGEHQARLILGRINYLPASKRRPMDTYWTLSAQNMVHTEFGNHQENVLQVSLRDDFDLSAFVESIRDDFGPEVVQRLNAWPDFVQGFELNAELNRILKDAGIEGDFGKRGHTPNQWKDFGSVKKTSAEFQAAYNAFRDFAVSLLPEA